MYYRRAPVTNQYNHYYYQKFRNVIEFSDIMDSDLTSLINENYDEELLTDISKDEFRSLLFPLITADVSFDITFLTNFFEKYWDDEEMRENIFPYAEENEEETTSELLFQLFSLTDQWIEVYKKINVEVTDKPLNLLKKMIADKLE